VETGWSEVFERGCEDGASIDFTSIKTLKVLRTKSADLGGPISYKLRHRPVDRPAPWSTPPGGHRNHSPRRHHKQRGGRQRPGQERGMGRREPLSPFSQSTGDISCDKLIGASIFGMGGGEKGQKAPACLRSKHGMMAMKIQ